MPHFIDTQVGKNIRAFRRTLNMTQAELAEQVGCRFQQIQKYETGANRVSASRLWMIAGVLKQPIHAFFSREEVPSQLLRLAQEFSGLTPRNQVAAQHFIDALQNMETEDA